MKPIHYREQDFKREVDKQPYSKELLKEFFDYWSEPDRSSSPKMRFEKEKTWDLSRRLARWAKNNNSGKMTENKEVVKSTLEIDQVLEAYKNNPTKIEFVSLAKWYDWLRSEQLMKKFTPQDVQIIKDAYGSDNLKCRAACVAETFKGYINTGLTFGHILEMRKRVA